ncbi:MAG: hypothetical protein JKY48_00715 [Flavobacteriales bacterium]|nr:hypothetical protein [Flavobacteriales bacterium]
MLSSILKTFKETIYHHMNQFPFEGHEVKVAFINKNKEEQLTEDAINVALFSSTEKREIMGHATFGTPTSGHNAIEQSPPLKLSLNVLLIFNLNDYVNALDSYAQVLGYFYNNNSLDIAFNGFNTKVSVLMSGFRDLEEIEIQSNFNRPGTPLLRYELNYALISGTSEQLPMVSKKPVLSAGIPQAGTLGFDPMLLNFIYSPVERKLSKITNATTTFCSIGFNQTTGELNEMIKTRFSALINSYDKAKDDIEKLKENLIKEIEKFPSKKNSIRPFIPSFEVLINLIEIYRINLQEVEPATKDNYDLICELARKQTEGSKALSGQFLQNLLYTTQYQQITKSIIIQVDLFNMEGNSTYDNEGTIRQPLFKVNQSLISTQKHTKWWQIQDRLISLKTTYNSHIEQLKKDSDEEDFRIFRGRLSVLMDALTKPLKEMKLLNKKHNQLNGQRPNPVSSLESTAPSYEKEYIINFTETYKAVNYPKGNEECISTVLADDLQIFLNSTIQINN